MKHACIVDDDFTSRELIGDYLKDQGWAVILLMHPFDVLQGTNETLDVILSKNNIELLIMDVRFGRDEIGLTQGLQYAKKLLEEKKISKNCKVAFVSQFGIEDTPYPLVSQLLSQAMIKHNWFNKPVDVVYLDGFINAE